MIIRFNAKKFKVGSSEAVIIPIGIAQNLDKEKEYQFTVDEAKKEAE